MVMLDEPMAGVNPALTQSLLGHIKDLREQGMTVLFVEHDMDMVRDISDWVIVMAQGRIIAEGPPEEVMADQAVIDAYLGAHHDQSLTESGDEPAGGLMTPIDPEHGPQDVEPGSAEFMTSCRSTRRCDTKAHGAHGARVDRTEHVGGQRRCAGHRRRPRGRLPAGGRTSSPAATSTPTTARWSASSVPTAPASPRCSRPCSAW